MGHCKIAQLREGKLVYFTCDDIASLKHEFRQKNGTDKIIKSGQKDPAYDRFCMQFDDIQSKCTCNDIPKCQKCAPEDHEGPNNNFCRCEDRNFEVGRLLRRKGNGPWNKGKIKADGQQGGTSYNEDRERSKREDSYFSEYGCSHPISFMTSEGIKTMEPGKSYDENLNEI